MSRISVYSQAMGRNVRAGEWSEQSVATYTLARRAVSEARIDDAVELARAFVDEAKVIYEVYRLWSSQLASYLEDKLGAGEFASVDQRVRAALEEAGFDLSYPELQWAAVLAAAKRLVQQVRQSDPAAALAGLEEVRARWQALHDRDVAYLYGLMDDIHERWGSPGIAEMYESLLRPLFEASYRRYATSEQPWKTSLEQLLMISVEVMRAHLSGPDRTGDFELWETEDRFVLRFDPCGSGGRTMRGDLEDGGRSLTQPPLTWGVSEEPASWNHYSSGMCLYCGHCVVAMEEMAIDALGYPVRVIDPPLASGEGQPAKCQWQIFKDPTAVPEEYYRRVGRSKPEFSDAGD